VNENPPAGRGSAAEPSLTLRFLGEMEVVREGRPLALPRSRKTRALLAYLALSGRSHRRARLCEMFWDVTDDPRGALRWSLSKIRGLVDEPELGRLRSDRDAIWFDDAGARVDLTWARAQIARGPESLPSEGLAEVARTFRGDLLEGLHLTEFSDFHAWCVAEREDARGLHGRVLRVLLDRLVDAPENALEHARALARLAPADEAARASLVRLLAATGRREEAEQQHDDGVRAIAESGAVPTGELAATWRRLRRAPGRTAADATPGAAAPRAEPAESPGADAAKRESEPAEDSLPIPRPPRGIKVPTPVTRYARSGDVNVAYQVFGEGPDLVLVPGWVSHVEYSWEEPSFARSLSRLRSFSRVILFDRRGTGLSDRVSDLPTLEQRMDDVRAVMDAAGSERASIFGISEGGPLAMLFAATYPERTDALVLYGTFARGSWHADYPWRWKTEQWEVVLEFIGKYWGTGRVATALAPSIASDPSLVEGWGRFERLAVSPGGAQALFRMMLACDVRHVLPAIQSPTLVLNRSGDPITTAPGARYIAEHVPGARYVELPGADHFPWVGDWEGLLDEVQEFVTGERVAPHLDRVLATVLFLDIVGSTARLAEMGDAAWRERLARFRTLVREELARFRGKEVDTAGDSFLATFDGPARAIECARSIARAVGRLDLEIRAGLHTGECEILEGRVAGIAVHLAARIAAAAEPREVLVSSTVKDLVAGSGIGFASRGARTLEGVPEPWVLFRVEARGDVV
jgi:pimeloyl-ACP methyl ester carboxylesterase/DNA-binding SARP family transcriptional activator